MGIHPFPIFNFFTCNLSIITLAILPPFLNQLTVYKTNHPSKMKFTMLVAVLSVASAALAAPAQDNAQVAAAPASDLARRWYPGGWGGYPGYGVYGNPYGYGWGW